MTKKVTNLSKNQKTNIPNQFKTVCNYLQYAFVIFSHQKNNEIKPNPSTKQKKKSKLDGLQKKNKKKKE